MYLSLLDCEYLNNRFDYQAWSVEVHPFNIISIICFMLLNKVFQVFSVKIPPVFQGVFSHVLSRVIQVIAGFLCIYLINFLGINLHFKYSICDVLHINVINSL